MNPHEYRYATPAFGSCMLLRPLAPATPAFGSWPVQLSWPLFLNTYSNWEGGRGLFHVRILGPEIAE
jgi:hypothetical protein